MCHYMRHIVTHSCTLNVVFSKDIVMIVQNLSHTFWHSKFICRKFFQSTHPSPTHTQIYSHTYTQSPPQSHLTQREGKKEKKERKEKRERGRGEKRKAHTGIIESKWPMGLLIMMYDQLPWKTTDRDVTLVTLSELGRKNESFDITMIHVQSKFES